MTWHLLLYAAISNSDAQTGANLEQCVWVFFKVFFFFVKPAMLFSTNHDQKKKEKEKGMHAEKLPSCSMKQ